MKKIVMVALLFTMCLSLCACDNGTQENNTIKLTEENISQYVAIIGSYTTTSEVRGLYHLTYVDLDVQAYSVVPGTFENVEITMVANIESSRDRISWKVVGTDDERVIITFRLPSTGAFQSSYDIVGKGRYFDDLKGSSDFTIVSVTGTFTPNK